MKRREPATPTQRAENRRVGVRVLHKYGLQATIANEAMYWTCQSCNSAQQQRTRRIQHVPSDHPQKPVILEMERREAVSCDDQHLGCCGSRHKHLSYGTLGRDSEGGRRIDGVGDEMTVAIARRTSGWRLTGSPRSPRATTSAWDAMDRVATTRHTAPWAGWRRAEMDGEGR